MTDRTPTTYYHAISQTRLKDAVLEDNLRGLTRSMFLPDETRRGIWLSDKFSFVFNMKYGEENLNLAGEQKVRSPIILGIEGVKEGSLQTHPLADMQFFYEGDMEWDKIKRFYVPEEDEEAKRAAEGMVGALKEKGIDVEVINYPESFFRESLKELDSKQEGGFREGKMKESYIKPIKEGPEGKF